MLDLKTALENYNSNGSAESEYVAQTLEFLQTGTNHFDRSNLMGHITGSAWLVSPDDTRVLLTHHRFLDKWLQFGGHADGDTDVLGVALREAQEESGIMHITPIMPDIFDVDVHRIPDNPRKNEPSHWHYDIRYLLRAQDEAFAVSDESVALRWFTAADLADVIWPSSMQRMIDKWLKRDATS